MAIGYDEAMTIGTREEKPNIAILEFYTDYLPHPDPAIQEVRAIDRVKWVKRGDSHQSTTSESIERLKEDKILWPYIEPMYKAWKEGQEYTPEGTPLEAWNGLTKEEVNHLKATFNIFTVEEFAEMNESAINRCKVTAIRLKVSKAQQFLSARSNSNEIKKELSSRDKQIEKLTSSMEAMRERMEKLVAENEELKKGEIKAPWNKK